MSVKKLDFSHAYGFADAVVKSVENPEAYDLTEYVLPDFFDYKSECFYLSISKPQKTTLLHLYIKNVNYSGIEWATGKLDGYGIVEEFGGLLSASGIHKPDWFNENDVRDHIAECDHLLEKASKVVTESAFQLLFSDRNFLFEFSRMIGKHIQKLTPSDSQVVKKVGVIKRSTYTPSWLKNAVFHRDKGRCQICGRDLTNLLVPTEKLHYDHMLPLEMSGTNDPTNYQLLCEKCNTSKGAEDLVEKQLSYMFW